MMAALKESEWHIQRQVVEPFIQEMIILYKGKEVHTVAQILLDGDTVKHIIMSAEEFKERMKK